MTDAFEAGRLAVADDPAALEPEQVLVLEIAGELDEFVGAVKNVPGLEFLADELEEDKVDPDEFAAVDKDGRRRPYRRELFLRGQRLHRLAAAALSLGASSATSSFRQG